MVKILTVLCGGTIGSRVKNGEIAVGRGGALCVQEKYLSEHNDAEFTVKEPFCISSEDIDDGFYQKLIDWFKTIDLSEYDGIIITHGTDTLSYTASVFGLIFCHVTIPIVFVSADYVPEDPRSNAYSNFSDAVSVIKSGARGIFAASDGDVILATRLCEADWLNNRFSSFDGKPIMGVNDGVLTINDADLYKSLQNFSGKGVYPNSLKEKILMISPYPGIDYSSFNTDGAAAVLHLLYHSSTANTRDLCRFVEKCLDMGKQVYIAPVKDGDLYSSTLSVIKSGALPIYRTSREAALAKLKIAYNSEAQEREEIINSNIFFERL